MTLQAILTHNPEHFNFTCNATIPEYWECEIVDIPEGLKCTRMYGTSQNSAQEAVQDLVDELKKMGLHGSLKVTK